jgi:hypothetical protein
LLEVKNNEQTVNLSFELWFKILFTYQFAAGGGGNLRFFHDQISKLVREKYLEPKFETEVHSLLVVFHLKQTKPQLIIILIIQCF